MKKLIFIISFLLCVTLNGVAQVKGSAYFDGYWSKWEYLGSNVELEGGYRGFIIYLEEEGPWHYRFKFTIDNFQVPNKKKRLLPYSLAKYEKPLNDLLHLNYHHLIMHLNHDLSFFFYLLN